MLDACRRHGMSFVPYFPLASGLLTGKYQRGVTPPAGPRWPRGRRSGSAQLLTDEQFARVEALAGFAREHGHTLQELALSWLASNPHRGQRHRRRDLARSRCAATPRRRTAWR